MCFEQGWIAATDHPTLTHLRSVVDWILVSIWDMSDIDILVSGCIHKIYCIHAKL